MSQDDGVILVLILTPLWVAWMCFNSWRGDALIDRFMKERGYKMLRKEHPGFFHGPFFLSTTRSQKVYYITVQDREGQIHRGYLRCGGALLGMASDHVEVIWDKPKLRCRPEPRGFPVILANEKQPDDFPQSSG